jgi:small subunit ribosomal protein S9
MALAKTQTMERAVGRRKTAAARVRLTPGTGKITVNEKDLAVYFPLKFWQDKVLAPIALVGREGQMDLSIRVSGSGVNAQAEAVRHGIARALVRWDAGLRPVLKAAGYLTRDPRARERKKFGFRGARRGRQWRKR